MNGISQESQLELDRRYRQTAIIYFSLLFTAVIVIIAGWFSAEFSDNSAKSSSLTPLWIAVIFIAAGTFVLRRVLTKWDGLKETKLLKGDSGLLGKLQTNSVILAAAAITVAVIGFVITQSTDAKADALRVGLVSLIVFFVNFPRKSVWQKIVASLEKV